MTLNFFKAILVAIGTLSVLNALTEPLLHSYSFYSLQEWLQVSYHSFNPMGFYKFFSYPFILPTFGYGITFGWLMQLSFDLYLLWMMGSSLIEREGHKAFYYSTASATILSAILAASLMPLFGQYGYISGPTALVLSVFTLWVLEYAEADILLFFLIPVKAKWLLAGIWIATLLINISQGNLIDLSLFISAISLSYLIGVVFCGLHGPFESLRGLDNALRKLNFFSKDSQAPLSSGDVKIVDLHTGAPVLEDDAFVDAMLAKIAKSGEKSLSWSEKQRLDKISQKKRR